MVGTIFFLVDSSVVFSNCSNGDIQLVGGTADNEGRVEVCINQVWGTVCYSDRYYSNFWDVFDGTVVCRQLGFQELGKNSKTVMMLLTCIIKSIIR